MATPKVGDKVLSVGGVSYTITEIRGRAGDEIAYVGCVGVAFPVRTLCGSPARWFEGVTAETITDGQIRALLSEAEAHGDRHLAAHARCALHMPYLRSVRKTLADAINEARAQEGL